jgi:hypothetical protein
MSTDRLLVNAASLCPSRSESSIGFVDLREYQSEDNDGRLRMDDRVVFDEPVTFMGVPASREPSSSKAAVLGIPFDCGFRYGRL